MATGHEVFVADVKRGGGKAGGIDHRAGGEGDAIGIDQQDLTVGADLAGNGGGGVAGDAVERGGGGRGLFEADFAASVDREFPPVDDGRRGVLFDDEMVRSGAADLSLAGNHAPLDRHRARLGVCVLGQTDQGRRNTRAEHTGNGGGNLPPGRAVIVLAPVEADACLGLRHFRNHD